MLFDLWARLCQFIDLLTPVRRSGILKTPATCSWIHHLIQSPEINTHKQNQDFFPSHLENKHLPPQHGHRVKVPVTDIGGVVVRQLGRSGRGGSPRRRRRRRDIFSNVRGDRFRFRLRVGGGGRGEERRGGGAGSRLRGGRGIGAAVGRSRDAGGRRGGHVFRRRRGSGRVIFGFVVKDRRRSGWSIPEERRAWGWKDGEPRIRNGRQLTCVVLPSSLLSYPHLKSINTFHLKCNNYPVCRAQDANHVYFHPRLHFPHRVPSITISPPHKGNLIFHDVALSSLDWLPLSCCFLEKATLLVAKRGKHRVAASYVICTDSWWAWRPIELHRARNTARNIWGLMLASDSAIGVSLISNLPETVKSFLYVSMQR